MSDQIDDSDVTTVPSGTRREPSRTRKVAAITVATVLVVGAVVVLGLMWAFWTFSQQSGGNLLGASPDPASKPGTITAQYSQATTSVPDVVTLPLATASKQLQATGLVVGTITEVYVDGYPVGAVVSQMPAAGSGVPLGSKIALTVSKGTVGVELPRVVGFTVEKAKSALAAAGLGVSGVTYVYDENIKNGIVMSLATAGNGTPLRGDKVALTASKGPTPVAMPKLVGLTPSQATKACATMGLGLTIQPSGAAAGIVYRQSPAAGSPIAPGSSASCSVDAPPKASFSAKITSMDSTWEKYNNTLGAHITCTSTSSDARGIASVRWQVQGLDVSATGTGKSISFILPGYRKYGSTAVVLTVVDTSGQTSSVRKFIKVNWDTGTLQ